VSGLHQSRINIEPAAHTSCCKTWSSKGKIAETSSSSKEGEQGQGGEDGAAIGTACQYGRQIAGREKHVMTASLHPKRLSTG